MPHVHAPSALPRQLRAEAVSLTFSGVRALKSVSLSLERGRVLGLIGPNGAGKTTMVNVLSGFNTPGEGRVLLVTTLVLYAVYRKFGKAELSMG